MQLFCDKMRYIIIKLTSMNLRGKNKDFLLEKLIFSKKNFFYIIFFLLSLNLKAGNITVSVNFTNVTSCFGGNNGSIIISASGNNPPFQYSVNGGNSFQNNNSFLGLTAGYYQTVVKDSSETWVFGDLIYIDQPAELEIANFSFSDLNCFEGHDGQIIVNASGGTAPLEYSKDNGLTFQYANIFDTLDANIFYRIKVKDSHGCSTFLNDSIRLEQPMPITVVPSFQNISSCNGAANGLISIFAAGGTSPYDYSINNGQTFQSSNVFDNLFAGNYRVVVRDYNNCLQRSDTIHIFQPLAVAIDSLIVENVNSCTGGNDGRITILASGGTPPYQFSVNNGNSYQSSQLFTGLIANNPYQIKVRDVNFCEVFGEVIYLTEPSEVMISHYSHTNVTCFGGNNGTITISAYGGTPPYYYSSNAGISWSSENILTGLTAGNFYQIAVKDEHNCQRTGNSVTIQQPSRLLISETHSNILCFGENNGSITLSAAGGSPPYQFSVDGTNFSTENEFDSLTTGMYFAVIRDFFNCEVSDDNIYLTQPTQIEAAMTVNNVVSCNGNSDGSIFINAWGGTPPYRYSIDNGQHFQNSNEFRNLPSENYIVVVKDFVNCTFLIDTVTLSQPEPLQLDSFRIENVSTCYGDNNGSVKFFVSGGTSPYYYSTDGGISFSLVDSIPNLIAGNYSLVVKDINHCYLYFDTIVTISQPSQIFVAVEKNNVQTCFGDSTGNITLKVSGGTKPYQYSILNGSFLQNDSVFSNLKSGNYTPQIIDSKNCVQVGSSINISQPLEVRISSVEHRNVGSCFGADDGGITINATGGIDTTGEKLFYSIDNGNSFLKNGGVYNFLYADTYQIVVRDRNFCTKIFSLPTIISQPQELKIASVFGKQIECFNDSNGIVNVTAQGGTPPFFYSIDNGQVFKPFSQFANLHSGTYIVKIKDYNECFAAKTDTVILTNPLELIITRQNFQNVETCYGDKNGSITLEATGGSGEYWFSINGGMNFQKDSGIFLNLAAQKYPVIVKDSRNCQKLGDIIEIQEPSLFHIKNVNYKNISCKDRSDGVIEIFAEGGIAPYFYSINDGDTFFVTPKFTNLLPQKPYPIRVKDSHNCQEIYSTLILFEPDSLKITHLIKTNATCIDWTDGQLEVRTKGGSSPVQYSLDGQNFQSNNLFQNLPVDSSGYFITIRDANFCTDTMRSEGIFNPVSSALFELSQSEGCSPLEVKFLPTFSENFEKWRISDSTVRKFSPTYVFQNKTDSIISIKVVAEATSNKNCRDRIEKYIKIFPLPKINFSFLRDTIYFPQTTIEIINQSQSGYSNYRWKFGDGDSIDAENVASHIYATCGTYLVDFQASNQYCTFHMKKNAYIFNKPLIPDFSCDKKGCLPYSVQFENISQNAQSYFWDFGDGNFSSERSPINIYTETGKYAVKLRVTGDCNSESTKIDSIFVYKTPKAMFEMNIDTAIVGEQGIHFYNNTLDTISELRWNFGNDSTSTEQNPLFFYRKQGVYSVQLWVKTSDGCTDSVTADRGITILPPVMMKFPSAFTPNDDGLNDVFLPFAQTVAKYKLQIFNRWGILIFESINAEVGWNGFSANGEKCPQDVYVWRVTGEFQNGKEFSFFGDVTLLR